MTATREITVTVPNVTEGRRDASGNLTIHALGDITLTLQGMTRDELQEWEWATDALALPGVDEATHRLAMNGWKVVHGGQVVGLLFQGAGTRVHVEVYDQAAGDYLPAGWVAKLRHGAAAVVYARQAAGQALPVDPVPAPVRTPEPARPAWYADGTEVVYHGSLDRLRGTVLRLEECECYECDGYQLYACEPWNVVAHHVRQTSVTAVQEVTDELVVAA